MLLIHDLLMIFHIFKVYLHKDQNLHQIIILIKLLLIPLHHHQVIDLILQDSIELIIFNLFNLIHNIF